MDGQIPKIVCFIEEEKCLASRSGIYWRDGPAEEESGSGWKAEEDENRPTVPRQMRKGPRVTDERLPGVWVSFCPSNLQLWNAKALGCQRDEVPGRAPAHSEFCVSVDHSVAVVLISSAWCGTSRGGCR